MADEKNGKLAFERSFSLSFGTETDVRDICGELVISHDPPVSAPLTVEEMLLVYINHNKGLPLALNIKADGLQKQLQSLLEQYSIEDYFVFDMSIPDTVSYLKAGMSVFTRQSDFEKTPAFLDQAKGVWLDSFISEWFDENVITRHIESGKQVCIVSPELHRRDHHRLWERLRAMSLLQTERVMLCTDYPEEARSFFYE